MEGGIVSHLLLIGGSAPKPPEFYALEQKNELWGIRKKWRQSFTPASTSFFCPTQALGLALQRHPILLVGKLIFKISKKLTDSILKNETTFDCTLCCKLKKNITNPFDLFSSSWDPPQFSNCLPLFSKFLKDSLEVCCLPIRTLITWIKVIEFVLAISMPVFNM